MTVAAVLLFASPESALFDAGGRPACRRMVEAAWAGGATPLVVVAADPDGLVSSALAGSPAVLAAPAPRETGAVGQITRGMAAAAERVTETDAILVWPGRFVWVDAETVTTLIEAHGARRGAVLRPVFGGQSGWPALVPMALAGDLAAMPPELDPDQLMVRLSAGAGAQAIETGDPGTVFDRETSFEDLPAYDGPPGPAQPSPEWGSAAAEMPDDVALAGPALAPYGQAADPESD